MSHNINKIIGITAIAGISIATAVVIYNYNNSDSGNGSLSMGSEKVADRIIVRNYYGQKGYLPNLPRGIRNNNFGNIIIANNNWQGKVPTNLNTDSKFEQFFRFEDGVRAFLVLLKNYMASGKTSIQSIIEKYAPANENDTSAYINTVSKKLNVGTTSPIQFNKTTALALVTAVNFVENGKNYPISSEQFETAYNLI